VAPPTHLAKGIALSTALTRHMAYTWPGLTSHSGNGWQLIFEPGIRVAETHKQLCHAQCDENDCCCPHGHT
jgi:hypothetical protein